MWWCIWLMCSGNCPGGCSTCPCGSSKSSQSASSWCSKYSGWKQSSCECIMNAEVSPCLPFASVYNVNPSLLTHWLYVWCAYFWRVTPTPTPPMRTPTEATMLDFGRSMTWTGLHAVEERLLAVPRITSIVLRKCLGELIYCFYSKCDLTYMIQIF